MACYSFFGKKASQSLQRCFSHVCVHAFMDSCLMIAIFLLSPSFIIKEMLSLLWISAAWQESFHFWPSSLWPVLGPSWIMPGPNQLKDLSPTFRSTESPSKRLDFLWFGDFFAYILKWIFPPHPWTSKILLARNYTWVSSY